MTVNLGDDCDLQAVVNVNSSPPLSENFGDSIDDLSEEESGDSDDEEDKEDLEDDYEDLEDDYEDLEDDYEDFQSVQVVRKAPQYLKLVKKTKASKINEGKARKMKAEKTRKLKEHLMTNKANVETEQLLWGEKVGRMHGSTMIK